MPSLDLTKEEGILAYLNDHSSPAWPEITKVDRLPEGVGGFVFRAHTVDSTTPSVIVKHVQGYAARAPQWKLAQDRMGYESKAMGYFASLETDMPIRTPRLLLYDGEQYVLVMEDGGDLPSLKGWLQAGLDPDVVTRVGGLLGRYLAHVHDSSTGRRDLLASFNGNTTAKYVSGTVYYGQLPAAAEKYGYADEYFREAAKVGEQEVMESNDVLTLGDFWTGNILVSAPSTAQLQLYVLDLELSKPGTAEFDIGQMAAEMYCLALFRDRALGSTLLNTFLRSYKAARSVEVDAAKVAIRIGAHFFVIMPSAWTNEASEEQIKDALRIGADLIRMGWERDYESLRSSVLGELL